MFSLLWIKRNFQQLSHVADYRLTIVFTIEIITYVTYGMLKNRFYSKTCFQNKGIDVKAGSWCQNEGTCQVNVINSRFDGGFCGYEFECQCKPGNSS